MKDTGKSMIPLAVGIGLAFVMQIGLAPALGPYWGKLLMDAGINIILAVSLNLVNGYTGQFSIGHAGFMAIGGYVAGAVTYYGSYRLWGSVELHGGFGGPGDALYLFGCVLGGMGSVSGATLAAIILTLLPELFRSFDQYRMIVYALSLIILMIVRPQGLFGIHEIWEFRKGGKKKVAA